MADTVNTIVTFSGRNYYAVQLNNQSDGTGESAVTKIDISTLTGPDGSAPNHLVIEEVTYDINGFEGVRIYGDTSAAGTDLVGLQLSGSGYRDFRPVGGLKLTNVDGTGDLLLTTVSTGAGASGDSYSINIKCRLKA